MEMNVTILLYILIYSIPFVLIGFVWVVTKVIELIKIRNGYVETVVLMEGGQSRKKFIKPKSNSIDITKDKQSFFKDAIGYVWRQGWKPFTIVRENDLQQLNLLETTKSEHEFSADDVSNLIIRSFQVGYIKGFKKNQMLNNLFMFALIGIGLIAILNILNYNTSTNTLNLVKMIQAGG